MDHGNAAAGIAETLRDLNHATLLHIPVPVGDVYDVVASLALAAGRVGQLLAQLDEQVQRERALGRLSTDDDIDVTARVDQAHAAFVDADQHAAALARRLGDAQTALAHLRAAGGGQ